MKRFVFGFSVFLCFLSGSAVADDCMTYDNFYPWSTAATTETMSVSSINYYGDKVILYGINSLSVLVNETEVAIWYLPSGTQILDLEKSVDFTIYAGDVIKLKFGATYTVTMSGDFTLTLCESSTSANEDSKPDATTLISPENSSSNPVTYTWNAVSDATWYYLWRDDSSGNRIKTWYNASECGCESSAICSITPSESLEPGGATWWIRTYNDNGYGPWSSGMTFTVEGSISEPGPPEAATLISPDSSTLDPVTFLWNAVSDSTWYQLWINSSNGGAVKKEWYKAEETDCASGTGYCSVTLDSELFNDGGYKWWIRTWNDQGIGDWSEGMNFSIGNLYTEPAAATLISPAENVSNPITFSWNAVSNATWYYLWVNDESGTVIKRWYTNDQAGCGSGTGTCSITPSDPTTISGNCQWWIQTYNDFGYGAWSSGMSFSSGNDGIDDNVNGWKYNNSTGHYYRVTESTNWSNAKQIAESFGGDLAVINNALENSWIVEHFGNIENTNGYNALHIGLSDQETEGDWIWIDNNASSYRNWHPNEPNNEVFPGCTTDCEENYAQIILENSVYDAGLWNDINNEEEYPGLVEKSSSVPQGELRFELLINGLASPTGIELDRHGLIFVAEYGNDRILKIDPSNDNIEVIADSNDGISKPIGLKLTDAGDLFISNSNKKIIRVNTNNNEVVTIVDSLPIIPGDIEVIPSGDIFVSEFFIDQFRNYGANEVVRINIENGEVVQSFQVGSGPYGLLYDEGDNSLLVAHIDDHSLRRIRLDNNSISVLDANDPAIACLGDIVLNISGDIFSTEIIPRWWEGCCPADEIIFHDMDNNETRSVMSDFMSTFGIAIDHEKTYLVLTTKDSGEIYKLVLPNGL